MTPARGPILDQLKALEAKATEKGKAIGVLSALPISASADCAATYACCTSLITSRAVVSASAALARNRLSAAAICPGFWSSDSRSAVSVASKAVLEPAPCGKRRSMLRIGLGSSRA